MRLCIIPARGGSKRIPRKNIKEFCGKPIIVWSIEAAIKMGAFGLDYFKDGWNSFDFIIVVSAWLGFLADRLELDIGDFDKLTGSLRISRIFKIVKKYKSLRILLSTFVGAI